MTFFGKTPCVKNPKRFSFWYHWSTLTLFYLIRFLVGASFEGSGSGFVFAEVAKIVKKSVKKMLNIGQCIGLIPYCSTPRSCWLLVTPTPTPWRPLTPWPRPTPAWSTRATWACAPTTSGPRSPASQSAQTRNQFQFYTNNINWYKLIQRCCQINFSNSWK